MDQTSRSRGSTATSVSLDVAAIDLALWDLAGRMFEQPVYKLIGGYRDRVKAYASTMCGDDLLGDSTHLTYASEFA